MKEENKELKERLGIGSEELSSAGLLGDGGSLLGDPEDPADAAGVEGEADKGVDGNAIMDKPEEDITGTTDPSGNAMIEEPDSLDLAKVPQIVRKVAKKATKKERRAAKKAAIE